MAVVEALAVPAVLPDPAPVKRAGTAGVVVRVDTAVRAPAVPVD
jgi:hypothetical protein